MRGQECLILKAHFQFLFKKKCLSFFFFKNKDALIDLYFFGHSFKPKRLSIIKSKLPLKRVSGNHIIYDEPLCKSYFPFKKKKHFLKHEAWLQGLSHCSCLIYDLMSPAVIQVVKETRAQQKYQIA